MAKIFISFFNGVKGTDCKDAMPAFYETFCEGLVKAGNDLLIVMHSMFNKDFETIPEKLLTKKKTFDPDLIFLFNNKFYDLSDNFECPIIIYDVDSPLYYSNKDKLKNNPNRYFYFESQTDICEVLKKDFKVDSKNILMVPFFTEIREEPLEKKYNICFIGSKFHGTSKNYINLFMQDSPNDRERQQYSHLLEKVNSNPFLTQDEILEGITSCKIKKNFDINNAIFALSTEKRLKTLIFISDLGLNIWGTSNWGTDNYNMPHLNLSFDARPVYSLKHNQDIYNSSKIGISISHLQATSGFPWRVADIMASDACLVTDYHADFNKYFPHFKKHFWNHELPCFDNPMEARKLCEKLLKNDRMREDIVVHCNEIINKNYRFSNVLKVMADFLPVSIVNKDKLGTKELLLLEEWLELEQTT